MLAFILGLVAGEEEEGKGKGRGEGEGQEGKGFWGRILNAYNSETVRARPRIWYTLFLLKRVRAINWNRFGDDRTKDNGVSGLDHVIG